jgi:GntR family transcriptional regulator
LNLNSETSKPIYIQIAEWIETEILKGHFKQDEKVYSQYKLAEIFTINPATAAKGLNVLSDEKILYNKRGLGKFVASQAIERIRDKRKNVVLKRLIIELVDEAEQLQVSEPELIAMLQEYKKEGEKK